MTPPPRKPCVMCAHPRAPRRGLCWACYRKMREARLLEREPPGRKPERFWIARLVAMVEGMSPLAREVLRDTLKRMDAA